MRIAFFHFSYDGAGGVERFLSIWANEFIRRGHEVFFISLNKSGKLVFDVDAKVQFINLGFPKKRVTILKPFIARSISRAVEQNNIDVVVSQSIKATYILSWAVQRYSIKAVGMEHLAFDSHINGPKHIRLRAKYYQFLDGFVTLTPGDEDAYRQLGVRKVQTIFNPVIMPSNPFHHADSRIILAVGRQDEQKNFSALLRVFKLLNRSDLKLQIVGKDYGTRQQLLQEAESLNISNQLEILDFTPHVSDFYREASVFLMTSRYEGLPLVLIEAKAHGLPCISFDCPTGPSYIINHGVDGFLVEMNNEQKMAAQIRDYLSNPQLQMSMSQRGIEDVQKRFSIPVLYQQWEDFLNSIIN